MITRPGWIPLALLLSCAAQPPAPAEPAPTAPAAPAAPAPTISDLACDPPEGHLAASLVRGAAPPTWVAIVESGAQPWDRWGATPDHAYNHYRDLALALAEGGGAVVVYDKRGIGASPGRSDGLEGRVRDDEAMVECVGRALPDLPVVRIGHSMGSVVTARAGGARAATVLLSTPLPQERWPAGPVLAISGAADPMGPNPAAELIAGADHLLMRQGALAPEVPARILAWLSSLSLRAGVEAVGQPEPR